MADHDIDALVDLATVHKNKWGDSCHHAMAKEILKLRDVRRRLLAVCLQAEKCRNTGWQFGAEIETLQDIARQAIEVVERG